MKVVLALCLAALIAIFTAIAHLSCIFIGVSCYEAQMAPPAIVQSAAEGGWLAPLGTVLIALVFVSCALFALSAAGLIKRLPLQNAALLSIACICLARGLATLPLSFLFPDKVSGFSLLAGALWFLTGALFSYGYYGRRQVRA